MKGRTTSAAQRTERHFNNLPFLFKVRDQIVLWSLHTETSPSLIDPAKSIPKRPRSRRVTS